MGEMIIDVDAIITEEDLFRQEQREREQLERRQSLMDQIRPRLFMVDFAALDALQEHEYIQHGNDDDDDDDDDELEPTIREIDISALMPLVTSDDDDDDNIVHMSVSEGRFALVTRSGRLFLCGSGVNGELGPHMTETDVPCEVKLADSDQRTQLKVASAVCAPFNTVVLTQCGRVYAFGVDFGPHPKQLLPSVADGSGARHFTSIACNIRHCLLQTSDHSVYEFDLGTSRERLLSSVDDGGGDPIMSITCGYSSSVMITLGCQVFAWGDYIDRVCVRNPERCDFGCDAPHNIKTAAGYRHILWCGSKVTTDQNCTDKIRELANQSHPSRRVAFHGVGTNAVRRPLGRMSDDATLIRPTSLRELDQFAMCEGISDPDQLEICAGDYFSMVLFRDSGKVLVVNDRMAKYERIVAHDPSAKENRTPFTWIKSCGLNRQHVLKIAAGCGYALLLCGRPNRAKRGELTTQQRLFDMLHSTSLSDVDIITR